MPGPCLCSSPCPSVALQGLSALPSLPLLPITQPHGGQADLPRLPVEAPHSPASVPVLLLWPQPGMLESNLLYPHSCVFKPKQAFKSQVRPLLLPGLSRQTSPRGLPMSRLPGSLPEHALALPALRFPGWPDPHLPTGLSFWGWGFGYHKCQPLSLPTANAQPTSVKSMETTQKRGSVRGPQNQTDLDANLSCLCYLLSCWLLALGKVCFPSETYSELTVV